jgi:hypothetical protein
MARTLTFNTKARYKRELSEAKFARFIKGEARRWRYPPNCTTFQ